VEYLGDIANHDTTPLKAAVIKGLLGPIIEENVTIVNANLIAETRGVKIVERKGPSEKVYNNLVRVHLHTSAGGTDITGTLAHDGPHIVAYDDVWIDIPAREGWLLLCENYDRPGTIGALGTLLGKHSVNINFMTVEPIPEKDRALMAVIVDDGVPENVIEEIIGLPNMISARVARFA
jgi:hypothetical protein